MVGPAGESAPSAESDPRTTRNCLLASEPQFAPKFTQGTLGLIEGDALVVTLTPSIGHSLPILFDQP
jgi:hypothetical protein